MSPRRDGPSGDGPRRAGRLTRGRGLGPVSGRSVAGARRDAPIEIRPPPGARGLRAVPENQLKRSPCLRHLPHERWRLTADGGDTPTRGPGWLDRPYARASLDSAAVATTAGRGRPGPTETTTRNAATTLTRGRCSVGTGSGRSTTAGSGFPGPAVKVVTMISSKDRPNARRPPATRAERSAGKVTSRKVARARGAEVHGGFLHVARGAAQPGGGVVEHHHHAEGRVADDQGHRGSVRRGTS